KILILLQDSNSSSIFWRLSEASPSCKIPVSKVSKNDNIEATTKASKTMILKQLAKAKASKDNNT
ncbi:21157_t:CDS:1, partial [Dentiscutata erythropus]